MAVPYYGDFPEDHVAIRIPFNTFSSDDPAVSATISQLAGGDIKVHKDGNLTQIVTDGASVVIDFDSITGNHVILIDSSAHADYSTGSEYMVRVEGTTIDGATNVNFWVGAFSIERAGGVLALMKATTLASIKAETALIVEDTAELQTDDYVTSIAALQTDLDTLTAGVTLAAGAITDASLAGNMEIVFETDFATNYNTTRNAWATNAQDFVGTSAADPFNGQVVAASVTGAVGSVTGHTNQTGDTYALANGATGFAAIDTVVDAIKAVTDDWVDGARLDLILDIIAADTTTDIPALIAALDTVVDRVETDTQDIQTRLPAALVNSRMDSSLDATGFEAAAVDLIWDEAQADHVAAGSFGVTASEIATIGTDTAATQVLAAGATGFAAIDTVVDAIKAVTDDWVDGARLDLILDIIAADTTTDIPALIAALDTVVDRVETDTQDIQSRLPAALVNSRMDSSLDATGFEAAAVDLIWDEAMVEASAVPAVTGTFRAAMQWLFALSRNKLTQTSTTTSLRNDADGADIGASTVSDDATTYTRGEWG